MNRFLSGPTVLRRCSASKRKKQCEVLLGTAKDWLPRIKSFVITRDAGLHLLSSAGVEQQAKST